MDYKKQAEIFDREAPNWDSKDTDSSENIKRVLSLSGIKENMKILDVGCGTGIMEQSLSETVGEGGFIKAIDISQGMLSVAESKHTQKNIIFEQANIETLTDSKETYDAIICNNVFPHFLNPDKVMENSARLLKKGGIFTVSHLKGREFVNNIHRDTDSFREDRVPVPEKWISLFEKYGFTQKTALDEKNFYIIVMIKK
ncbi:MAG: class I SAM-dependent methyltransferase [Armatimonadetes bacterium]|nr:class I SAM-dependent methyltransferase [Candidatus Hippobium faecium]